MADMPEMADIKETVRVTGKDTKSIIENIKDVKQNTKYLKEKATDIKEDAKVTREKVEVLTEVHPGKLYLLDFCSCF